MCNYLWMMIFLLVATPTMHAQEEGRTPSDPPAYIGPAVGERAVTNRALTMVSSLAVSPEGRLWVTWYAGPTPGEDVHNYVVLATSGDDGETWEEVLVVDPDGPGPIRAFDPEIWTDPLGRLWLIWAQAAEHGIDAQTWVMVTDEPESSSAAWSEPRIIAPGVMMCKPTVLNDGTWVFPVSDWEGRRLETPDAATARAWISTDHGETFTLRGAARVPVEQRTYDEHMFIERKDGALWVLIRTRYGIGESISTDGGLTWPEVTPSDIPHPSARFFITRLQSGNLLLVKHGPMEERTGRSHLTAFVSHDDGQSWEGGLLLDERSGISYPDGQQSEEGTIYITYDFDRTGARQILFTTFLEADALAGEAVTDAVRFRQLVSQGSGGQQPAPPTPKDHADGEVLRKETPGVWAAGGFESTALITGAKLFTDREYLAANIPDALDGTWMLRVPIDGEKNIQAARAGTVYLLTPEPDRNRDSQSQQLMEQGFQKVALPEVPLFNPDSAANFCTLYQKDAVEGETVTVGKWAVPVYFP